MDTFLQAAVVVPARAHVGDHGRGLHVPGRPASSEVLTGGGGCAEPSLIINGGLEEIEAGWCRLSSRFIIPRGVARITDCVVSQWYWGDYSNKLPAVWRKRDLFNILYGTGPMFMFSRDYWNQNRTRFVQSYKDVCTVTRRVGYDEMTDHRFLTTDRDLQQTQFAGGVTVTVNFGERPARLADGTVVAPMGYHVTP